MTTLPLPERLHRLLSFLELDPHNPALLKEAAHAAAACGQWERAADLVAEGRARAPADGELRALAAFVHLHAHRFPEAIGEFAAARELGTDSPKLRHDLAYACFMNREHRRALDELDHPEVLAAAPLAWLLRARCLHHLQRLDDAVDSCERQLAIEPESAESYGLLALLKHEQGQLPEARALAGQALERAPWQLEALLALASLSADAGEFASARREFKSLLQMHPSCGRGWLGLALVEMMCGRLDAARVGIEIAARHLPEHLGTWHVLAWLHVMRGDAGAARQAFEHALSIDRNFAESHGGLAVVDVLQQREIEARERMRRAQRLDPRVMSVHYAQMLLLQSEGRHEDARQLVDDFMARRLPGGDPKFRHLLALQMSEALVRGGPGAASVH